MSVKLSKEMKERFASIEGLSLTEDPELLEEYSVSLDSVPAGDPLCLVRPGSTAQVTAIVDLANESGLNLVPVSSGPPHSHGGTTPSGEGVMLDLRAMSEIKRLDRRNKVAIVEPGVTFATLCEAARKVGLKVLMPLMPRSTKSVLASYLEREPILIPKYHWDTTDPLLCQEIVFGTGDLFRTGSAAGPGTLEQQWEHGEAQKNPMGPGQTDFGRLIQGAQGSLGVVTWGSVKLEVMPSVHRLYMVADESLAKLTDFTYRVLKPKLPDEFLMLNSFALAAMCESDPERIKALAARQAPFTVVYGVSGYEYFPEERAAYVEADIADAAQVSGVDIRRDVAGINAKRMEELLANPSPEPYWKTRFKGGCREVFFLSTLDRLPAFLDVMGENVRCMGYPEDEVGVYVQPIQHGRSVHACFDIYYDPADAEDAAKTEELFLKVSGAMLSEGAFFSRPYGAWTDIAYARCPDTVDALKKVKGILDPAGVLNRGKLCF